MDNNIKKIAVRPGDRIDILSENFLGSRWDYYKLLVANPLYDPLSLKQNIELVIPDE